MLYGCGKIALDFLEGGNYDKQGKHKSYQAVKHLSTERTTTADPVADERDWLTTTEFANCVSTNDRTVRRWIEEGKLKAQPHPIRTREKVVPYSEVRRLLQFDEGSAVSYDGRTYPHQVFLFYLSAKHGLKIGRTKEDLRAFKLYVPPDDALRAMAKSVYESCPKTMVNAFKRKRDCTKRPEFEEWIERLGFGEIYEDETEYIPFHIMRNHHVRWVLEICAGAGFKPIDVSNLIRHVCDVIVDPRQVSNYVWMFYYTRQMPQNDWSK
jgi:hypothetical protein